MAWLGGSGVGDVEDGAGGSSSWLPVLSDVQRLFLLKLSKFLSPLLLFFLEPHPHFLCSLDSLDSTNPYLAQLTEAALAVGLHSKSKDVGSMFMQA